MDFRTEIRSIAKGQSPILEIGPSYNPILSKKAGFSVKTVDHASQQDLIEKYTNYGIDVSKIEAVDYITTDISSLLSYGVKYKLILASHVIEHTTDIIKFINDCSSLLDDDGKLLLLVPDKRCCFDLYRPLSTAGAAIDAHLSGRSKHRGSVFDHYAYFTLRSGAMAWGVNDKGENQQIHSSEQCLTALNDSIKSPEYVDAHEWVFTPKNFEMVIQDLNESGMIGLNVEKQYDSLGYEFFSILSKVGSTKKISRSDYLYDIRREELTASLQSISPLDVITLLADTHPELKLISLIDEAKEAIIKSQYLQSENKKLHLDINRMRESSSWQITAPIRSTKILLSKIMGKDL